MTKPHTKREYIELTDDDIMFKLLKGLNQNGHRAKTGTNSQEGRV